MNSPLSPNSQAILLLTAPLCIGRRAAPAELLKLSEYNRLARLLRNKQWQPADLIGDNSKEVLDSCASFFVAGRLEKLLDRGFLLSQAVEHWHTRSIWVLSRADNSYPRRLKSRLKEDAPPILYGCGEISLLETGGLAVVGSRHVTDELNAYAENVGRLAASAKYTIISGAAKGIDSAAMLGTMRKNGVAVGVLSEALERAALARANRESLMDHRLVIVSPYDPTAGFNVGHAMQRNKLIYALADAALVVTSEFEKGGTWAGAIEQLQRFQFAPVFVYDSPNAGKGNSALLKRGAHAWPSPNSAFEFTNTVTSALESFPQKPKQEALSFAMREQSTAYTNPAKPVEPASVVREKPEVISSPAEELFKTVREILRRELVAQRSEEQIMALLGVTKAQTKEWLTKMIEEGEIEKIKKTKPAQYRTSNRYGPLL